MVFALLSVVGFLVCEMFSGVGLMLRVGHPFDLVKVRMQTAESGVYKGAFDVVRRTVAKEGVFRVCSGLQLIAVWIRTDLVIGSLRWCLCAIDWSYAHV